MKTERCQAINKRNTQKLEKLKKNTKIKEEKRKGEGRERETSFFVSDCFWPIKSAMFWCLNTIEKKGKDDERVEFQCQNPRGYKTTPQNTIKLRKKELN